jgi:hypothetical protein
MPLSHILPIHSLSKLIFYFIKKKYNQKLEEYFDVNKSIASKWRNNSFPERRVKEFFLEKEL